MSLESHQALVVSARLITGEREREGVGGKERGEGGRGGRGREGDSINYFIM